MQNFSHIFRGFWTIFMDRENKSFNTVTLYIDFPLELFM